MQGLVIDRLLLILSDLSHRLKLVFEKAGWLYCLPTIVPSFMGGKSFFDEA